MNQPVDYPEDVITGFPDHYIINGDTSSCGCPEHEGWWATRTQLEPPPALSQPERRGKVSHGVRWRRR